VFFGFGRRVWRQIEAAIVKMQRLKRGVGEAEREAA